MSRESDCERMIVLHWLTRHGAEVLGPTLGRAYPIEETPGFDEALAAIDEAERRVWDDCDPNSDKPD